MYDKKELKPIYDKRNNFYKKAYVVFNNNNNIYFLSSYNTFVAYINEDGEVFITDNDKHLTHTTLRHIKEFLKQNSIKAESKKQILNDYKRVFIEQKPMEVQNNENII